MVQYVNVVVEDVSEVECVNFMGDIISPCDVEYFGHIGGRCNNLK